MARPIDADALVQWLKSPSGFSANCEDCTSIDCLDCIIEEAINNAPTIEAEPVRHGRWVEERGDLHSSGRVVTCALCRKQHFIPSRTMSWWVSDESVFQKPDRCRNCGAKMEEGAKDA